ncbi:MAG: PKD domain-containing protein, partial [Thermoplasmata archaeon]
VYEGVNGSSPVAVAVFGSEGQDWYVTSALDPGTTYTFQVVTVDDLSGGGNAQSSSNLVTIRSPGELVASSSATPNPAETGATVRFVCDESGGVGPYTYLWSFGDGDTSPLENSTHAFANPGRYTATCNVTDDIGSRASSALQLKVDGSPTVAVSTSAPAAAPGTLLDFTATASGGASPIVSYSWTFGDGTTGSGANVTHAYAAPGNYTVTVTVTRSGASPLVRSVNVTIVALTATATESPLPLLTGMSANFAGVASGGAGSPYTFNWSFGDGSNGSGAVVNHTFASAGTYLPALTVTDLLGASVTIDPPQVRVYAPLAASVRLSTASPTNGTPTSVEATVSGGTGSYNCTWTFGDGTSGTGCAILHTWASPGRYSVQVLVTDPVLGHITATSSVVVAPSSVGGGNPAPLPTTPDWRVLLLLVFLVPAILLAWLLVRAYRREDGGADTTARRHAAATGAASSPSSEAYVGAGAMGATTPGVAGGGAGSVPATSGAAEPFAPCPGCGTYYPVSAPYCPACELPAGSSAARTRPA